MSEQDLEMSGLGIKLITVQCREHPKVYTQLAGCVESYAWDLNEDDDIVKPNEIYERLSSPIYTHYSTLLIRIDCCYRPCRGQNLRKILNAIQCNKSLRNKLKVIFTSYVLYEEDEDNPCAEMWTDFDSFISSQLENTFLFQEYKLDLQLETVVQQLFSALQCQKFITAQEMQMKFAGRWALIHQGEGNVELYFYAVNPALVIIINNYYFRNGTREGSDKDVHNLIHMLEKARTHYILKEDISRAGLQRLTKYLSRKNLKLLQSLYFIIMSHGSANDMIHTKDGKVNFINDILQPIQFNDSLKETSITFFNVHCRGEINAEYAAPDAYDKIQQTQIEQLKPNISINYSVPNSFISPRIPESGAPFIACLCKAFDTLDSPCHIKTLHEKICSYLQYQPYYEMLDCFSQSSELVMGDDTQPHCIKPMSVNAKEFIKLFKSIKNDFRKPHNKHNYALRNRVNRSYFYNRYTRILNKYRNIHHTRTSSSKSVNKSFCLYAKGKQFQKYMNEKKYICSDLNEETCYFEETKSQLELDQEGKGRRVWRELYAYRDLNEETCYVEETKSQSELDEEKKRRRVWCELYLDRWVYINRFRRYKETLLTLEDEEDEDI
ncbi:uncharacterized protein LOC135955475 [Calliphora vicina]|uniref:uncharacterized protein LOC135955475 n=1 Tax=Calliphora vicina TaxID=7373 RepID=UPI00325B18DD